MVYIICILTLLLIFVLGHDELTNAFNQISNGIKNKDLEESDLSIEIIDNCLYTYPSPPPDLLIRTSGETRLSDFMIWQVKKLLIKKKNVLFVCYSSLIHFSVPVFL